MRTRFAFIAPPPRASGRSRSRSGLRRRWRADRRRRPGRAPACGPCSCACQNVRTLLAVGVLVVVGDGESLGPGAALAIAAAGHPRSGTLVAAVAECDALAMTTKTGFLARAASAVRCGFRAARNGLRGPWVVLLVRVSWKCPGDGETLCWTDVDHLRHKLHGIKGLW